MCTNANKTAVGLLTAIEPTLKNLLAEYNQLNTPAGEAAIAAYDAALAAVQGWTQGTAVDHIETLLNAFTTAVNSLKDVIPANALTLINIILAGIAAVLGVLKANSPAPTPATVAEAVPIHAVASNEELQAHYALTVAAETTAQVQALVPHFKRSVWHSAPYQYKKTWNDSVTDGGFPQTLHVS